MTQDGFTNQINDTGVTKRQVNSTLGEILRMDSTEEKQYLTAFETTGFAFENEIAAQLENACWILLTNKYYIDDVTSQAREIDIIAYKYNRFDDITLYTALVISCKKSAKNDWVFATRELRKNDPNIKYHPLTIFTNSKIIKAVDFEKQLLKGYEAAKPEEKWLSNIFEAERFIFGFQEVSASSKAPQNDKPIYESISTLIKAINYEMRALQTRKKTEVVYNFHLVSVFDTKAVEINYDFSSPKVIEIDRINYLSRFIVNKEEAHHLIQFATKGAFSAVLSEFDNLHNWYYDQYTSMMNSYKKELLKKYEYRSLFANEIKEALRLQIEFSERMTDEDGPIHHVERIYVESNKDNTGVVLELVPASEAFIDFLNNSKSLLTAARKAFKKYYKVDHEVKFGVVDDIPF